MGWFFAYGFIGELDSCSGTLSRWGRELSRKFRNKVGKFKSQLVILRGRTYDVLVDQYKGKKCQLVHLLKQEDSSLKKKKKEKKARGHLEVNGKS